MPIPTPFHPRTSTLCTSYKWTDWAGYASVCAYTLPNDYEYYAVRHSAGLIDITPLYKYEVSGPDAAPYLAFVMARDIQKVRTGRATYCCWCDDHGKIIDDGSVFRLAEHLFQVNTAEPMLTWFSRFTRGFDVEIQDVTQKIAALALQGPTSRDVLKRITDVDLNALKYFQTAEGRVSGLEGLITRTGYTGDLGYEIWVKNDRALELWDALTEAGKDYLIRPVGLDALDMVRIEAGLILNGVEFFNANHCFTDSRKSTPFELGLGWTVDLDRDPFIGQQALKKGCEQGSRHALVGLELDWEEQEAIFEKEGLPAQVPWGAWRAGVPVYEGSGRQIGKATSGLWSPIVKKNLALASIEARYARPGSRLKIEYTVEYRRNKVTASVTRMPFYDPEHKRS